MFRFLQTVRVKNTGFSVVVGLLGMSLIAGQTLANPLPPGGGPVAVNASSTGGLVQVDETTDFDLIGPGNVLLFRGTLVNRVLRRASGKLAFGYRILSRQSGLNGSIHTVATVDFTDFSTDVTYDPTSPPVGSAPFPQTASRTVDGSVVTFSFGTNPVFSSTDSKFFYIDTDAEHYTRGGATTLIGGAAAPITVTVPTFKPTNDSSPPIVEITSPDPLACVCNPVKIIGTANDPEGFTGYTLEYSTNPAGPWFLIASSFTPVVNGVLAMWDTTLVAQGYYFIRLTALNDAGLFNSFTTIVFVDKQFDTVDLRSPGNGNILGGIVCFDGTVNDGNGNCPLNYRIEYMAVGGPFIFNPVDPAVPVHNGAVINDPLGSWNTASGPTAVPDGDYKVRVTGTDDCGHVRSETRDITIDNTAPIGVITDPKNCGCVDGIVPIFGTASDAHLAGWTLQYTGGDANGWVTIASGNTNVVNGFLANWNTNGLRPCCYTIRLIVSDQAGVNCSGHTHQAEFLVSLDVGDCDETGPILVKAVSRKTHGPSGDFDIDLPLADPPAETGVECRAGGPTLVVFTFNKPVKAADGTPDGSEVALSHGTVDSVGILSDMMFVRMSGVPDEVCLKIQLSGISDLAGNALMGDDNVHVRVLLGDTNATGSVSGADVAQTRSRAGQVADGTNFRSDTNTTGSISGADVAQVRSRAGHAVSCP